METSIEENSKRTNQIDRFVILRELGRGGTGIVYLVRSKESGRQFAMKTLKPDPSEESGTETGADAAGDPAGETGMVTAELLQAEAQTLAELNGGLAVEAADERSGAPGDERSGAPGDERSGAPGSERSGASNDVRHGIPAYYGEVYRNGRFTGFLMEYVEGESLQKSLSDGRVFTIREAAEIGVRLCRILTRLHEMDPPRIYRDLKPGNILVQGDGNCVLVDFGAVRAYRKGASQDTRPLGTEGYAAPEQYGGWEQSDPRTDVYGVGAVLHHMLTGRPPLETGLRPIAELLADEDSSKIRQYSGVDKILLRACSIAPSMRYPSCRELEKALSRLCRGKPEMPFGWTRRLVPGKCADRESAFRRFMTMTCASLALLVGAGLFSATASGAEMSRYHALIRESERIGDREMQGTDSPESRRVQGTDSPESRKIQGTGSRIAEDTGGQEGRLEALRQAIMIRPRDSEAYLSLLRGLSSDGILTQEEKELMEDFLYENGYPAKMREWRPEKYARLEIELGKVYFGCYEEGTEAARRAFGNAAESPGIGREERDAVRAMCEVLGEKWTADRFGAWQVLIRKAVSEAVRTGDGVFAAAVCCRAAGEIALFPDRFSEDGADPADLRELAKEVREFAKALHNGWPEAPAEAVRKLDTAAEAAWRVCARV